MTVDQRYRNALAVIGRVVLGWHARRNGSGFLQWERSNVWEAMTEGEAAVIHDATGLPTRQEDELVNLVEEKGLTPWTDIRNQLQTLSLKAEELSA